MSTSEYIIEAENLTKEFAGMTVVRGVNLKVRAGGCFGLLGPNGAGKTTTLKMLLGQSPPTGGRLRVFGLPMPQAVRRVRAAVGVVPQTDNLDPDFTVLENLKVYGSYFGVPQHALSQRIEELLDMVGLSARSTTPINKLSGGMKRRLSIARALINNPRLLVLDEPTTGLDPQVRHLIWSRLRQLKQNGKTLLLTTHYMEEAERLCDTLVVMDHGVIIAEGPPQELIRSHVKVGVFEIHDAVDRVRSLLKDVDGVHIETVGDTSYCYATDAKPVAERLDPVSDLTYVHRNANLEDVFLTLTGRDLRE